MIRNVNDIYLQNNIVVIIMTLYYNSPHRESESYCNKLFIFMVQVVITATTKERI